MGTYNLKLIYNFPLSFDLMKIIRSAQDITFGYFYSTCLEAWSVVLHLLTRRSVLKNGIIYILPKIHVYMAEL